MRKGGLLWGLLLLMGGILFLLDNLGFLPISALSLFFPGVLILIGLWFLLGPLMFRQVVETRTLSLPANGSTAAQIKFRHGAGKISIGSLSAGNNLLEGTFAGGVEEKIDSSGSETNIRLSVPEMEWWGFPSMASSNGFSWDVMLNKQIAYALDIKTGASKTSLDLHDLIITDLNMDFGGNGTEVFLPEQAGKTTCHFNFGSATLELHVPSNVAARIKIDGTMLETSGIDEQRFPKTGGIFCSPDYSTAANTIDITVEAGVGKVIVH